MAENAKGKIEVILYVAGATPEKVAAIIESMAKAGDEIRGRICQADNGVLVTVRETDAGASEVRGCLTARFGSGRVVDASRIRPSEVRRVA